MKILENPHIIIIKGTIFEAVKLWIVLFNYENLIVMHFGETYSINTCLAYALQFSHLRSQAQITSQKTLLSKDMMDIKKYIDKYKADLSQEVYNSQEFSIKLLQIPKVSNTNRSDLAIEFVNWSSIDENDRENYSKVTAIIKDKLVKRNVSNVNLFKPNRVVQSVEERTGLKISINLHSMLWKSFDSKLQ